MYAIRTFLAALLFSILAGLMLGAFAQSAQADDELWLTSGMWSRHPNEDHYHYNQHNVGIGLAYTTGNQYTFVMGEYDNSLRQHSEYIGIINQPYTWGHWHFGYLAGFVSGYTKTPKFYPAVAPVVTLQYKYVGINLIVVPSVVTAVQVKVKLLEW